MPETSVDHDLLAGAGLDAGRIDRIVGEALMGADDGELFLETSLAETLAFDDGRLKTASRQAERGFGLRAVGGERVALASGSVVDEAAIVRAAETVRAAAHGQGGRANVGQPAAGPALYTPNDPQSEVEQTAKIAVLAEIDAYLRTADTRVRQVSASLTSAWQAIEIRRGDGDVRRDIRPLVRLNIAVVVAAGGLSESGSAGAGGRYEVSRLLDPARWRPMADDALRQALVKLDAVAAPAGEMTVVLGPGWPGILLHEAIGHGLEGDFNRKGSSAFAGLLGQRVAAPGVTIVDDGTIPDRRGSLTIDDEGTPSACNVLIEDGILVGFMQDRQNARLMGVAPTGNGRRQGYAHKTMPRMTNTYMRSGTVDPGEILAGVKRGLYATQFGGGQVDITSGKFVFQASEAYLVEDGRITAPVKGATLIGSGADALTKIRLVGNDMALDDGIGTCGKNGQGVPVGVGQPTLLIDGLTVGGTAA